MLPGAELTSVRSPRVKAARQLAKRALRQRARQFLAEGPQAVGEALAAGGVVTQLFVTAAAQARYANLIGLASGQGADVHAVSGEVMTELAQTITPQGVLAVCDFIDVDLDRLTAGQPRLAVVLANVRDPGNAGTVLRTADAAGAGGVIFAGSSVDPYNSKCVRASAGSLFHLPVVTGPHGQRTRWGPCGSAACGCSQRTAGPERRWTTCSRPGGSASPPPGCSATRPGGCPVTSSTWPTTPWRCPSTAGLRA